MNKNPTIIISQEDILKWIDNLDYYIKKIQKETHSYGIGLGVMREELNELNERINKENE